MKAPTQIKICGLTSIDVAKATADLGVDAIGLVFHEASPRNVDIKLAVEIARAVGPFVSVVGLFVNREKQFVDNILKEVPLHILQFHGKETPSYCEQFNRPYLKAIKVAMKSDVESIESVQNSILESSKIYQRSSGILLDVDSSKGEGGTGELFDWACIPPELTSAKNSAAPTSASKWVLAGGLNPGNVLSAIEQTQPFAVDVSSGVESSPGQKDIRKIESFVANVRKSEL